MALGFEKMERGSLGTKVISLLTCRFWWKFLEQTGGTRWLHFTVHRPCKSFGQALGSDGQHARDWGLANGTPNVRQCWKRTHEKIRQVNVSVWRWLNTAKEGWRILETKFISFFCRHETRTFCQNCVQEPRAFNQKSVRSRVFRVDFCTFGLAVVRRNRCTKNSEVRHVWNFLFSDIHSSRTNIQWTKSWRLPSSTIRSLNCSVGECDNWCKGTMGVLGVFVLLHFYSAVSVPRPMELQQPSWWAKTTSRNTICKTKLWKYWLKWWQRIFPPHLRTTTAWKWQAFLGMKEEKSENSCSVFDPNVSSPKPRSGMEGQLRNQCCVL